MKLVFDKARIFWAIFIESYVVYDKQRRKYSRAIKDQIHEFTTLRLWRRSQLQKSDLSYLSPFSRRKMNKITAEKSDLTFCNNIPKLKPFLVKTPSQDNSKDRPPVFVENSMDCHNIQMSVD